MPLDSIYAIEIALAEWREDHAQVARMSDPPLLEIPVGALSKRLEGITTERDLLALWFDREMRWADEALARAGIRLPLRIRDMCLAEAFYRRYVALFPDEAAA